MDLQSLALGEFDLLLSPFYLMQRFSATFGNAISVTPFGAWF